MEPIKDISYWNNFFEEIFSIQDENQKFEQLNTYTNIIENFDDSGTEIAAFTTKEQSTILSCTPEEVVDKYSKEAFESGKVQITLPDGTVLVFNKNRYTVNNELTYYVQVYRIDPFEDLYKIKTSPRGPVQKGSIENVINHIKKSFEIAQADESTEIESQGYPISLSIRCRCRLLFFVREHILHIYYNNNGSNQIDKINFSDRILNITSGKNDSLFIDDKCYTVEDTKDFENLCMAISFVNCTMRHKYDPFKFDAKKYAEGFINSYRKIKPDIDVYEDLTEDGQAYTDMLLLLRRIYKNHRKGIFGSDPFTIFSIQNRPALFLNYAANFEQRSIYEHPVEYEYSGLVKEIPLDAQDIDVWKIKADPISDGSSYKIVNTRKGIFSKGKCPECSKHKLLFSNANKGAKCTCNNGRIVCPDCKGKPVPCPVCNGSGYENCFTCGGTGRTKDYTYKDYEEFTEWEYDFKDGNYFPVTRKKLVNKTMPGGICPECHGEKSTRCNNCDLGYVECYTCKGEHTITCPICDGKGYQVCKICYGNHHILNQISVVRKKGTAGNFVTIRDMPVNDEDYDYKKNERGEYIHPVLHDTDVCIGSDISTEPIRKLWNYNLPEEVDRIIETLKDTENIKILSYAIELYKRDAWVVDYKIDREMRQFVYLPNEDGIFVDKKTEKALGIK